jgi:hypothetical protein
MPEAMVIEEESNECPSVRIGLMSAVFWLLETMLAISVGKFDGKIC